MKLHWLTDDIQPFPDTASAWGAGSDAPGLLAAGGSLSPQSLLQAYRRGIFPWFNEKQPILWWSPDPRMVLHTQEFKVSRSLRKTLTAFRRSMRCEIRIDSAFRQVMGHCAQTPRGGQQGTWITDDIIDAYGRWHEQGKAHSFETWIDGTLVGGLYGVGLGRMFFGESMFSHRTDASKIALAALVAFCRAHGIGLIDCQQNTAHLSSLGGRTLSRTEFEAHLQAHVDLPQIADWSYHPAMWEHLLPTLAISNPLAPRPVPP